VPRSALPAYTTPTPPRRPTETPPAELALRGVIWERVRPIRWLWARRIPLGFPSLLVGEEGVGKGTLVAWVIGRATRGELDGDLYGQPTRVLLVGDEDAFEPVWVPRLHIAGADLMLLRTPDDGESLADLRASAEALRRAVERQGVGLVVFDALLDHIDGGRDGAAIYNPKHIRDALAPLRRVAREHDIAVLGLLHPIKGRVTNFRDLAAGSHQLNAVSRSSLLLGVDPADEDRRVLVRGKGNHSANPSSFEFGIHAREFALNGHGFEMPLVVAEREGDRTLRDLLGTATPTGDGRDVIAYKLEAQLTAEPTRLADLARAVGRDPKDGTVRRALEQLADDGRAVKSDAGWSSQVLGGARVPPPTGVATRLDTPVDAAGNGHQERLATDAEFAEMERTRRKFEEDGP
jgi:hypothetical protein